jgi:hypothetical protein
LIAEVLGYGTLLVAGWLILKTVVAVNRLLNGVHVADRLLIPAASWIDRRWPGLLGEWGMRNRPAGD